MEYSLTKVTEFCARCDFFNELFLSFKINWYPELKFEKILHL